MEVYLGLDVGSVSTNIALMNKNGEIVDTSYLRTQGQPIKAVQEGIRQVVMRNQELDIIGAGATGSGRQLAEVIIGADAVKNEITAHAVAAMHIVPEVKTVIEIGGQDSKIIILEEGLVTDFAMNTVCAAGTGSFLDQQAMRLNIPIEDFGRRSLESEAPVRVAGRCAVFAESDMIHKQQAGHRINDILNGLCQALVRNYFNNVGKGKRIAGPVVFQGGVAANEGMRKAFEEALGFPVIVPPYHKVMGAIGAALLAREALSNRSGTKFRGLELLDYKFEAVSFECDGCGNGCEVVEIKLPQTVLARWGDRCGKWSGNLKLA